MRALIVYCHPCPDSFSAAMRDVCTKTLKDADYEVRVLDLYAENFNPVMSDAERKLYHEPEVNELPVAEHIALIKWCDTLVFVYPTWWYGLPAVLKGWLDRVWVPHVAFTMPTQDTPIRPNMQHIKRLAVITTCGAPWIISKWVGEPGKRTILRGMRALCARNCKTLYQAHYKMDTATPDELSAYLGKIKRNLARFAGQAR